MTVKYSFREISFYILGPFQPLKLIEKSICSIIKNRWIIEIYTILKPYVFILAGIKFGGFRLKFDKSNTHIFQLKLKTFDFQVPPKVSQSTKYTPASVTEWDPPHSSPQWKIFPKMAYFCAPVEKSFTPLESCSWKMTPLKITKNPHMPHSKCCDFDVPH